MRLYEFGPTRSIRVRWTLQELEADFESVIVNLRAGEHRVSASQTLLTHQLRGSAKISSSSKVLFFHDKGA